MGISKYNSEGYYDPVVYEALTRIEAEERAARAAAAYRPLSISVRLMREMWRRIRSGQGRFPDSRWKRNVSRSLRICSVRSIWMKRQSGGWG